jgi:hypothetical protein
VEEPTTFVKIYVNHDKKSRLNFLKNHTCRWYDDTQRYKISCPNLASFAGYKNKKFLKMSR